MLRGGKFKMHDWVKRKVAVAQVSVYDEKIMTSKRCEKIVTIYNIYLKTDNNLWNSKWPTDCNK